MKFSKEKEIVGHSGAIYSIATNGVSIYSASADKYVVRWKLKDGSQDTFAINFEYSIYTIELIGNEFLIAGLSSGDLHIFNLNEKKEIKFYQQHKQAVFSIKYNAQKKQFYVGDAEGNLSVWDSQSLELIIYLPLDCGKIRSIAINPSGNKFVIACQDGFIRVFETDYFNEIHSMNAHENGATAVLFHPKKEELIISGGKDALLKIWSWVEEIEIQKIVAHTFAIYDILSLKNGGCIATASRDKNIKIWSFEKDLLKIEQRLDLKSGGHRHSVNALAKISEEQFLSCSDDKKMIVWG